MAEEPKIKTELTRCPTSRYPGEMSLINGPGLGVVLMVVLIWMSYAFFPPGG
jgi:hypothetical protein